MEWRPDRNQIYLACYVKVGKKREAFLASFQARAVFGYTKAVTGPGI